MRFSSSPPASAKANATTALPPIGSAERPRRARRDRRSAWPPRRQAPCAARCPPSLPARRRHPTPTQRPRAAAARASSRCAARGPRARASAAPPAPPGSRARERRSPAPGAPRPRAAVRRTRSHWPAIAASNFQPFAGAGSMLRARSKLACQRGSGRGCRARHRQREVELAFLRHADVLADEPLRLRLDVGARGRRVAGGVSSTSSITSSS